MDLHGNAALSWSGNELAHRVVDHGWTVRSAAAASGVSVRCARKWVGRYRDGDRLLLDRFSVPRRVANRTCPERVAVIIKLRRLRMTAAEIAETLAMPLSTVSVVLKRNGLGRLGRPGLEQPVRYERSRPGELIHIDVKKLGRIDRPGHRVTGDRRSLSTTPAVSPTRRCSPTNERRPRLALLGRALVHALACRQLGIRHLRTRPSRPQTNGKAERFIRTMLNGWAHGAIHGPSRETHSSP
jgi:transposase InsO family protein